MAVISISPVIDDATYQSLLGRLRKQGYAVSQFQHMPQMPDQISIPDFQ